MRSPRRLSLLVVSVLAGAGVLVPQAHADAAGQVLYVDNAASAGCSDTGTGTSAQPYCTIQAAADVVTAGQTIQIAAGDYAPFNLTRSGTPEVPIAVRGEMGQLYPSVYVDGMGGRPAVTISGTHDVDLSLLNVHDGSSGGDTLDVTNSQNVTLDRDSVYLTSQTSPATSAALRVSGSSHVTVSHADLEVAVAGSAARVESGSAAVDLASDLIESNDNAAVSVSGAHGVDVVGDQLSTGPAPVVAIDGSTSAVVENDTLIEFDEQKAAAPLVTVAADSTAGVHEDYNAFSSAPAGDALYDWGGTTYATPAALAAANGQGAHDLGTVPEQQVSSFALPEGSPLIDSGDAAAAGELSTDYLGNPRVDDTTVVNSGTGYVDRGGFEFQDPIGNPVLTPDTAHGLAPFALSVAPGSTSWGVPLSVSVDFGDGSAQVAAAPGLSATHTYTTPGAYTETTTTTDAGGSTHVASRQVIVGTADAPRASLRAIVGVQYQSGQKGQVDAGNVTFDTSGGPNTWEIASEALDFGDGTGASALSTSSTYHGYKGFGVFTARLTVTDVFGRTTTAGVPVVAGEELWGTDQWRPFDSRNVARDSVPAHSVTRVKLIGNALSPQPETYIVNVTVTDAEAPGYVTSYADGQARPATSTVNFAAGQTIANQTAVTVGADGYADFYNGSGKPISLIVDSLGSESTRAIAYAYQPLAPTRVLDTRTTGHPVAGHGSVAFQVAGLHGVPADAKAVLLNVTTTDTRTAGFVTAYGEGQSKPNISNSNWSAGQTIAGQALVGLQDGKVVLANGGSGAADFVADLAGYYSAREGSTVYLPVGPSRVLDTRSGVGAPTAQLGAHQTLRVQVAGRAGTYAHGAAAALLNLTVTGGLAAGDLIVYPDGSARPGTSALNWSAGETLSNAVHTSLGSNGWIDIYNASGKPVSVIADLSGIDYLYATPAV